jgi:hypothetical protein
VSSASCIADSRPCEFASSMSDLAIYRSSTATMNRSQLRQAQITIGDYTATWIAAQWKSSGCPATGLLSCCSTSNLRVAGHSSTKAIPSCRGAVIFRCSGNGVLLHVSPRSLRQLGVLGVALERQVRIHPPRLSTMRIWAGFLCRSERAQRAIPTLAQARERFTEGGASDCARMRVFRHGE